VAQGLETAGLHRKKGGFYRGKWVFYCEKYGFYMKNRKKWGFLYDGGFYWGNEIFIGQSAFFICICESEWVVEIKTPPFS
jgi:hypothetical protein